MKNVTLFLIIALTLSALQPAFAAFPVKHAPTTSASSARAGEAVSTLTVKNKLVKKSWFRTHIPNAFHPIINYFNPENRRSDTNGILSLIFGILGLIPLYGILFSIPAIILGAIGRRHDEQFSLTGLILGIVGIVLSLVEIIIIAVVVATSL